MQHGRHKLRTAHLVPNRFRDHHWCRSAWSSRRTGAELCDRRPGPHAWRRRTVS